MQRLARDRLVAGLGVALIELALGLALFLGLSGRWRRAVEQPVTLLQIGMPPPPAGPWVKTLTAPRSSPAAAAAPPNLRAIPSALVVPPPVIALAPPPPILAAPVVADGANPSAGATDMSGPGTGADGEGNGRGGGSGGDGDGGGWVPPRHIRGRISDADFPRAVAEARGGGTVSVRYRVGVDGRVGDCLVTASSGDAELDALTCRLIRQRFRFAPSRDGAGRKVPSIIVENHSWVIEPVPPERTGSEDQ